MPYAQFDTHTLISVIQTLPPLNTYWLDLFFQRTMVFDQEYIDFDVVTGARRMAPFVAPTAQGKPIMALGYTTKRFKPAYIKPKDILDPQRIIKRRAGEALLGSLSLAARRNAVLGDILQEHKNQITRRWEWMACQALVNGSITIIGDDYPSTFVDFLRDAGQTVTLSGGALWTATGTSHPIDNLETWIQQTQRLSGYVVTRVTMGTSAWAAYRKHADVLAQLNVLVRGTTDTVVSTANTQAGITAAQLVGHVGSGVVPIYVYNDIYEDNSGTQQPFLDPTKIVLTTEGIDGVRCFGAIMDADAGYTTTDIFVKQYRNQDPSVEYVLSQSAPLMVPTRPNASLTAKVV